MKIIIIYTTTDSDKIVQLISEKLLTIGLTPCVQIFKDIETTYKWHGKLQKTKEFLIAIKTLPKYKDRCKKLILNIHNYDTPEIICNE